MARGRKIDDVPGWHLATINVCIRLWYWLHSTILSATPILVVCLRNGHTDVMETTTRTSTDSVQHRPHIIDHTNSLRYTYFFWQSKHHAKHTRSTGLEFTPESKASTLRRSAVVVVHVYRRVQKIYAASIRAKSHSGYIKALFFLSTDHRRNRLPCTDTLSLSLTKPTPRSTRESNASTSECCCCCCTCLRAQKIYAASIRAKRGSG